MFDIDVAIQNENGDVLNRGEFAEKLARSIMDYVEPYPLTIGLNGSWGSGKTSLINLTLNYIEKSRKENDYVIVHFNPWFFSNQKNLFLQFFKQIINALKIKEKENESIVERTATPQRTLFQKTEIEALEDYSNYIRLNLDEAFENTTPNAKTFLTDDSLGFYKKECDNYFEELKFKVIVVIDDIERLVDFEINQIFTLVKSLANFKNFIYLLSFDKAIIAKSLDGLHSEQGDKFIDKIIQIPIVIPPLTESKLNELIQKNLEPIYVDHFRDDFINQYNRLLDVSNFLNLYIKDIRDLKRFTNLLNFYWTIFAEQLNINDFILMLAIQLFDYDLFLKIKKHKDILTVNPMLFAPDDESIEGEVIKAIEDFKGSETYSDVKRLLAFLFPVLSDHTNIDYKSWDAKLRVCSANHFDKYFLLSLQNNEISELALDKLIAMESEKEIYTVLSQDNNLDYNHSLIYNFIRKIDVIPQTNCRHFARAILKCSDEMNLYPDSRRFIPVIIKKLLRRIDDEEESFAILNESAKYENNTFTHSQFIHSHTKITSKIFTEPHFDTLKAETVEKINRAAANPQFLKQTTLKEMLLIWKHLENEEKVKKYVLDNVKEDEDILSFLSKFRTKRNAKIEFDCDELDTYHGLDFYKAKAEEIKASDETQDEIKEFCNAFLKSPQ